MGTTNARKAKQLGMPLGTATHRLRKQIMFTLLERLDAHYCHVCHEALTEDDFTIEHKAPWFERDTKLFWDLDNIAFSHAKCNRPDRPRTAPRVGHGTAAMYGKHDCRCDECCAWKKAKNKRDYELKKAKRARLVARVEMEQAATL